MTRKRKLCIFTGSLLRRFGAVVFVLLLFCVAACGTEDGEEDPLPLSVTMRKDDFEVTLSVPKSVYYVKELREEDIICVDVTVRYVGEEDKILIRHGLDSAIRAYDSEGFLPSWDEEKRTSLQRGESCTFSLDWEGYSREYSEQGIYKISKSLELEFLNPETEERTGKYVKFGLNVFPVEIREKKGKAVSFKEYEALWRPMAESEYLTEKAESYAKERKEAGLEKEFSRILAGRDEGLIQYAVFYQENGLFSGVEIVTQYGREFFTAGKEGERQSLYTEAPPELSEDGKHLQFSVIMEATGKVYEYRVYVTPDTFTEKNGGERTLIYLDVTGKLR